MAAILGEGRRQWRGEVGCGRVGVVEDECLLAVVVVGYGLLLLLWQELLLILLLIMQIISSMMIWVARVFLVLLLEPNPSFGRQKLRLCLLEWQM